MTTSDKPRRKTFALPDRAGNPTSSIEFTLGTETFECKRVIDGLTLLEFAQIAGSLTGDIDEDDPESVRAASAGAGALKDLLSDTIIDYSRFEKFVRANSVDLETLGEIAGWLVEAYSDRPTQ